MKLKISKLLDLCLTMHKSELLFMKTGDILEISLKNLENDLEIIDFEEYDDVKLRVVLEKDSEPTLNIIINNKPGM